MEEKKSGLQKKISSIFQGMPNLEPGLSQAPQPSPQPAVPVPPSPPSKPSLPERLAGAPSTAAADFLQQLREASGGQPSAQDYASPQLSPQKQDGVLALDLGERCYKLLRLSRDRRFIEAASFHEWTESLERPIELQEQEQALADMLQRAKARHMPGVLALPSDAVSYHLLRMPVMPQGELRKALQWEIAKKSGANAGEIFIDHETVLEKSKDDKVTLLVTAAQAGHAEEKIEQAETGGMRVEAVSAVAQALAAFVRRSRLFAAGQEGALLDLGFGSTTICFFHGTELQYARTLAWGAKDVLSAMTGAFQAGGENVVIGPREALLLQQQLGVPGDAELKTHPARALVSQLSMRLRPALEHLAEEIRRSLEYYVNQTGLGPVTALHLCGGAAQIKGLPELLAKELGMGLQVLKPFDALGIAWPSVMRAGQSAFTVALGLALRAGGSTALLPPAYRWRALDRQATRWAKVIMTASLAGFFLLSGVLQVGHWMLTNRLATSRQQTAALAGPAQQCKRILEIQGLIAEREKKITGRALRQPLWEGVLKELSNTIPDNLVLTEMGIVPSSVPKTLRIAGIIYADNLSADSQLSAFVDRMALGPYFLSFDLASRKNMTQTDAPASTFEIRGVLEY